MESRPKTTASQRLRKRMEAIWVKTGCEQPLHRCRWSYTKHLDSAPGAYMGFPNECDEPMEEDDAVAIHQEVR